MAPILGENRAIVRLGLERLQARARGPGVAALLARRGSRAPTADRHGDDRLRARAADQRGRARWARRSSRRACCSPRTPTEADRTRGAARGREPQPAGPDEAGDRRRQERSSTRARGRGVGPPRPDRRRRSSAARGRSASSGSSRRGSSRSSVGPPSSARSSATIIRASCRSDGTLDLGAALEACARPVHPPRRSRRRGRVRDRDGALAGVRGAVPALAAASRPGRSAHSPSPIDIALPAARRRLRPASRASPGWRRAARATRSRSSPSSA